MTRLCITAWAGGSALLSLGLTVGETMGIIVISRVFMAFLALGNGWIGGEWHIGFTVAQRFLSPIVDQLHCRDIMSDKSSQNDARHPGILRRNFD